MATLKVNECDFTHKASILVATYKRLDMFKQCYESLVKNPGIDDYELFIWDNGSGKKFHNYLRKIEKENPNVKVHYGKENLGCKVYSLMAEQTNGEHIVFMDDDVIEFPDNWLADLIEAYWDAPFPHRVWGMLTTNVVQDDKTNGALWTDKIKEFNSSDLQPTATSPNNRNFIMGTTYGGWCAITHRFIYKLAGGFTQGGTDKFFAIDGSYGKAMWKLNLSTAIYKDLKVYHASGPWWNQDYPELWEEKAQKTLAESAKEYLDREPSLTALKELI